ncbi:MAG: OsmC family protein [Nitrososphaerales archaeon]
MPSNLVKFEQAVSERTKRNMQYVKEHEKDLPPRTISIRLQKWDNFLSEAKREGSDLIWYADESKERGGEEKGASPLSYFLSSMGFCQLVHYSEHSMVDGINIDALEMKVDGKIVMQKPRRFTDVTYEVRLSSRESDATIKDLARKAAEDCYVTNTLKRACNVTGVIFHNGKQIDEHR